MGEKERVKKLTKKRETAKKDRPQTKKKNKVSNCCNNVHCILLSSLLIALAAVSVYLTHSFIFSSPGIPELSLEEWWGHNVTTQDISIRPFRIVFAESMKQDLYKRFDNYRNSQQAKPLEGSIWDYGVNNEVLGDVVSYWMYKYNLRERERFLNQFDNFKTNIQGLDIHFVHVKPNVDENVKVLPLLLLHGWPGSIRDFYEVIPVLTNVKPGYDFVFEVVVPSLPGFGFSQAAAKPGLNPVKTAIIMRNLMSRLGFTKFFIQGGDFGHSIGSHISTLFPKQVLGFHTNFPVNFSNTAILTWILGGIWPRLLAGDLAERMYPLATKASYYLEETGYMHVQCTKPDTIGIALQDSPVGLAAYVLDKFVMFTNPEVKYNKDFRLSKEMMTRFLDNVMVYWLSGSITTSMRMYKESIRDDMEQIFAQLPTSVPTWSLRTKHELMQQPDFILRWKYPNLRGSTTLEHGGHFAALEIPEALAGDVFVGVKSFLDFWENKQ